MICLKSYDLFRNLLFLSCYSLWWHHRFVMCVRCVTSRWWRKGSWTRTNLVDVAGLKERIWSLTVHFNTGSEEPGLFLRTELKPRFTMTAWLFSFILWWVSSLCQKFRCFFCFFLEYKSSRLRGVYPPSLKQIGLKMTFVLHLGLAWKFCQFWQVWKVRRGI